MRADEQISVVIPAFNEAPVLERVITDLMEEVVDRVPGSELIVVDDCSSDGTPELLRALAGRYPALRVIRSEVNRGHGPSVVAGLDAASRTWVFLLDSDGQFLIGDFWKLWAVREDAHLVLGCRQKRADPRHRRLLTRLIQAVVSWMALQPLPDPNVPFKLIRRRLWLGLRAEIGKEALAPSLMISLGAALGGWKIKIVPVTHLPREHGPSTLRAGRLLRFSMAGLRELIAFRNRLLNAPLSERGPDQAELRSTHTT